MPHRDLRAAARRATPRTRGSKTHLPAHRAPPRTLWDAMRRASAALRGASPVAHPAVRRASRQVSPRARASAASAAVRHSPHSSHGPSLGCATPLRSRECAWLPSSARTFRLGRRRLPQFLQTVEFTHARQHDMNEYVLQINQHPFRITPAFDANGAKAARLRLYDDVLGDGANVAVGGARGDHHRVGDVGQSADVELFDVDRLHVFERGGHDALQCGGALRGAARATATGLFQLEDLRGGLTLFGSITSRLADDSADFLGDDIARIASLSDELAQVGGGDL